MLNIVQNLLLVDMWNSIVLGQLCAIERLSTARFACNCDFKRFQASLFAELVLDLLYILCQTTLAVPLEASFFFLLLLNLFAWGRLRSDKDRRWLGLDVQHDELLPVKMQIKWCLLRVDWSILNWDISGFNQSSTDTVWDSLDQLLLRRLLRIVNTKDILSFRRWRLEDLLDHSS